MTQAKLIRKNAVINEYKSGKKIREIARNFAIDPKTVREYLRDYRMSEAEEAKEKRAKRSSSIIKAGKEKEDRHKIAEKHNVSVQTVNDIIRQDRAEGFPLDILYKQLICLARHKSVLRRWAKDVQGRTIKTPEGKMTVLKAYPNILECASPYKNGGYMVTTFTLGEVYYMNQGG